MNVSTNLNSSKLFWGFPLGDSIGELTHSQIRSIQLIEALLLLMNPSIVHGINTIFHGYLLVNQYRCGKIHHRIHHFTLNQFFSMGFPHFFLYVSLWKHPRFHAQLPRCLVTCAGRQLRHRRLRRLRALRALPLAEPVGDDSFGLSQDQVGQASSNWLFQYVFLGIFMWYHRCYQLLVSYIFWR